MTHTHPFAVTVHVPTPEALHELSIFLQQFAHKHYGHHQSFAAETAAAAHHQAPVHHQHTASAAGADHFAGMGMPGAGAAAALEVIPSQQDVIAFQKRLLEGGVLTMPALMKLYTDLGINPVEPLQPHHCAAVYKHLSALPGAC